MRRTASRASARGSGAPSEPDTVSFSIKGQRVETSVPVSVPLPSYDRFGFFFAPSASEQIQVDDVRVSALA